MLASGKWIGSLKKKKTTTTQKRPFAPCRVCADGASLTVKGGRGRRSAVRPPQTRCWRTPGPAPWLLPLRSDLRTSWRLWPGSLWLPLALECLWLQWRWPARWNAGKQHTQTHCLPSAVDAEIFDRSYFAEARREFSSTLPSQSRDLHRAKIVGWCHKISKFK